MAPFMSDVPRPYMTPSRISAPNGSTVHPAHVANRNDIRVACETEIGRRAAKACVKIVDAFEWVALGSEAERFQGFGKEILRAVIAWVDSLLADEGLGEGEGVVEVGCRSLGRFNPLRAAWEGSREGSADYGMAILFSLPAAVAPLIQLTARGSRETARRVRGGDGRFPLLPRCLQPAQGAGPRRTRQRTGQVPGQGGK